VPGRLAIAAFDDIEIARLVTPALTTIRVPRLRIGQTAADMILARLAGRAVRKRIVDTGFELVIRDSA
jgi:LacI family transcriptional regulator, gluconate utilization system Gnt-I transcriptional repressor